MNSIQLKKELIDKISKIDDINFLNAFNTILDFKHNETYIELTAQQEHELLLASIEARKGNVISQLEMDKNVEKWLGEK